MSNAEETTPEQAISADEASKVQEDKNNIISPLVAIASFIGFALIYFLTCFFVPKLQPLATAFFFLLVLTMQILINIKNSQLQCGSVKGGQSIIWGVMPVITIIAPVFLAINLLPGINKPFSNTFGYAIAIMFGAKKKFRALMPKLNEEDDEEIPLINEIYNNPSLLVNEMTPKNFTYIISRLSKSSSKNDTKHPGFPKKILKPEITKQIITEFEENPKNTGEYHKKLKALLTVVTIKDYVGKFMWLLLAGILACTISYNKIMGIDCTTTNPSANALAENIVAASEGDQCAEIKEKEKCIDGCQWTDGEDGQEGVCSKLVDNAAPIEETADADTVATA